VGWAPPSPLRQYGCAREPEPRVVLPVPSRPFAPYNGALGYRNGIFSERASPFFRPSEMADMAISRGAVIPRDSFAVTTVIAIRSAGGRVIGFSLDRSDAHQRLALSSPPSLSLSLFLVILVRRWVVIKRGCEMRQRRSETADGGPAF